MELVIAALVVFFGWWLSARLHPYVRCETCKGAGKHTGSLAKNSTRACHKCSGKGIKQRPAARFFGVGDKRKSTSRLQRYSRDIND